jgi:uncharacterized DUF497 family protein
VDISFDPDKRATTLERRGLDFADAGRVFMGDVMTIQDNRFTYGEQRFITAGYLNGRCVVIVWTPRNGTRRIISMRHAHANEERIYFP